MGQQMEKRPKKLLDQVHEAIRLKHYSIRTEEATDIQYFEPRAA
jgi:hypothetical protein